jgi:hypothetical protein
LQPISKPGQVNDHNDEAEKPKERDLADVSDTAKDDNNLTHLIIPPILLVLLSSPKSEDSFGSMGNKKH